MERRGVGSLLLRSRFHSLVPLHAKKTPDPIGSIWLAELGQSVRMPCGAERSAIHCSTRASAMSTEVGEIGAVPASWTRRHLLGLEDLSAEEITLILDKAARSRRRRPAAGRRCRVLAGRPASTCSSRTRPARGPASRWPPGGWGPTRSISRPPPAACRRARRSSTRPRTSRRWASTWWSCGTARPARRTCWPRTSTAR